MNIKKKITLSLINATKPGEKEILLLDTEVRGFGVRVTPRGAKSYFVRFRLGRGRDAPIRKPTIAAVGELAALESLLGVQTRIGDEVVRARSIAADWKAKGKQGVDAAKAQRQEAQAPTIERLCADYMQHHGSKKRSASEDARRIGKLPRRFLRLRVKDVTHADIEQLHRSMEKRPYEANRVLSLISKMFSLAIRWRWIETNPAQGVVRFEEQKRERFLLQTEIERLDAALSVYSASRGDLEAQDAADAIRLLLLTGARSGELMSATWNQFNLDAGVWTKPSSHTKTKKVHKVALSAPAVGLLEDIRARRDVPGHWVFPGRSGGHRKSLKAAWSEIRVAAGIEDVRIHDLRHTSASLMLSAGVPLDVVGRVLGHTQAQTTLRYAHLTDEAGKAATDALGKVVKFKTEA
jgi:integrase